MPSFRYTGKSPMGEPLKGVVQADSINSAARKLREQSIVVLDLAEDSEPAPAANVENPLEAFCELVESLLSNGNRLNKSQYEDLLVYGYTIYRRNLAHQESTSRYQALLTKIKTTDDRQSFYL